MRRAVTWACRYAVLAGVFLTVSLPCNAESSLVLHYAGYAMGGEAKNAENAFPHSIAILREKQPTDINSLDSTLNADLKGAVFDNFVLTGDLGNSKSGDALSIAFVLTWENVAQEQIGQEFKVTVDLRAEALVFDFQSLKVIAAYPFGLQSRQVLTSARSAADIHDIVRNMYFGRKPTVFDLFVKVLQSAKIKRAYGAYAQVTGVDLEDKATTLLTGLGVDQSPVKDFIAGAFEAALAKNASIPVLPYVKGQAIGGKMSARFANGDIYNLTLPEPDFRIHLTARGFKKVELDSNRLETGFGYASYFRVNIGTPLVDKPFLDADFKYAVTKIVPKGVEKSDDWAAYQESMLSLVDGLTKQFASSDNAWIEKWGGAGSNRSAIEASAQALARCR